MIEKLSKRLQSANILGFFKTGSIGAVSAVPVLLASLLVFIWVYVSDVFRIESQIGNYLVLFTAAIIVGSTGIIYIYRKEMPGPTSSTTIKGGCAVVSGYIFLLFFWLLGLAGFIFAF